MEYIDAFVKVFIVAIAGAIIVFGKWLFSVKKNTDQMIENGKTRADENQVQFKMLRSQGKAVRATLEVVSKIQNNGNVTAALKSLDESEQAYNAYSDNLVRFKEPEKVRK